MIDEPLAPRPVDREEHERGLSHTFLEKAIQIRTMDRGLLALTATAALVLVLAAVLLVVRELPMPMVSADVYGRAPYVPLPILVATAIFMTLAWSYILTGALHAHLAFRAVALVAYTAVMISLPLISGSPIGALGGLLVLMAVWAMAVTLWVADRILDRGQGPVAHHRVRLKVPTFLFFLVATALLFLIAALGGSRSGGFGGFVLLQLVALQFGLIPMLYLAGTDFAEWSEVVSGRLSSLLNGLAGRWAAWVTAALVVVVGLLIVAERYMFYGGLRGLLVLGGEALAALALMSAFGWAAVRHRAKVEIPFVSVVAVGLLGVGTIYGGAILGFVAAAHEHSSPPAQGSGGYATYRHTQRPVFTIEHPAGWTPGTERLPDGRPAVVIRGTDASELPVRFVVLAGDAGTSDPELTSTSLQALLRGPVATSGTPRQDGPWQAQDFSLQAQGTDFDGTAWTRVEGSERWLLAGVAPAIAAGSYDSQFAHMVDGWKPEAASEGGSGGEAGKGETNQFVFEYTIAPFVWLAAFVASILLIRRGGAAATAGLYLASGGIFFMGFGLKYWLALLVHVQPPWWVLATTMESVTLAIAAVAVAGVLGLAAAGRLTARYLPLLRLVLVLLLGLVGLRLLYQNVFEAALTASKQFTLVQAIVLLVALLWDVLMSGQNLTNRHGRHVPRHSRVLIYFGYTMLVATAVLYLNSVKGGGENQFESDQWPQLGIQLMGLPLLLTFFFVNVGAWIRRSRMNEGDPVERHELTE